MKKIMMTFLIIILIMIAMVVVGVVAFILFVQHREANYYNYTEVAGEIEKRYTALGDKEVTYQEYDAGDDTIGKYAVWYPSELETSDNEYPVVIFANGTGRLYSSISDKATVLSKPHKTAQIH